MSPYGYPVSPVRGATVNPGGCRAGRMGSGPVRPSSRSARGTPPCGPRCWVPTRGCAGSPHALAPHHDQVSAHPVGHPRRSHPPGCPRRYGSPRRGRRHPRPRSPACVVRHASAGTPGGIGDAGPAGRHGHGGGRMDAHHQMQLGVCSRAIWTARDTASAAVSEPSVPTTMTENTRSSPCDPRRNPNGSRGPIIFRSGRQPGPRYRSRSPPAQAAGDGPVPPVSHG